MFGPENAFLTWLGGSLNISLDSVPHGIIGSNFVAGKDIAEPVAPAARTFLAAAQSLRRHSRARYDDDIYYLPYFRAYFTDLESAFRNVASALALRCRGYIIVVDNTHRGIVIPVAAAVIDTWRALGFQADVERSEETFHIGTKNPRARGLRAKHTQYVIRISR
jgi:hypothetical protein